MTDILTFKFFYPMLFITIGIIAIVSIGAIKSVLVNFKDKDSQNFQFKAHVEEHTDTTTKMANMHDTVAKTEFTTSHEQELHKLEIMILDLNDKVDILIHKVAEIEAQL